MSLTIKELCVDLQKTRILKNINLRLERENLFASWRLRLRKDNTVKKHCRSS